MMRTLSVRANNSKIPNSTLSRNTDSKMILNAGKTTADMREDRRESVFLRMIFL